METITSRLERARNKYTNLQTIYSELMDKLEKDADEHNSEALLNVVKRALSLYVGEFPGHYSENFESGHIIHKWKDHKYVNILYQNNNIGFACLEDDLLECDRCNKFDFWLFYCKDKRYKKCLDEFIIECKSGQIDFIESFRDFLNKSAPKGYYVTIDVINNKELKIKNLVMVLINEYKNN